MRLHPRPSVLGMTDVEHAISGSNEEDYNRNKKINTYSAKLYSSGLVFHLFLKKEAMMTTDYKMIIKK